MVLPIHDFFMWTQKIIEVKGGRKIWVTEKNSIISSFLDKNICFKTHGKFLTRSSSNLRICGPSFKGSRASRQARLRIQTLESWTSNLKFDHGS